MARAAGVPEAAVAECLRLAGVNRDAVDCVAVVRPVDPSLHFSLRNYSPEPKSPWWSITGPRRFGLFRVAF